MPNNFSLLKKIIGIPKHNKSHAYKMGCSSVVDGANHTNCHFSIFSSPENATEWERGARDAKQDKPNAG